MDIDGGPWDRYSNENKEIIMFVHDGFRKFGGFSSFGDFGYLLTDLQHGSPYQYGYFWDANIPAWVIVQHDTEDKLFWREYLPAAMIPEWNVYIPPGSISPGGNSLVATGISPQPATSPTGSGLPDIVPGDTAVSVGANINAALIGRGQAPGAGVSLPTQTVATPTPYQQPAPQPKISTAPVPVLETAATTTAASSSTGSSTLLASILPSGIQTWMIFALVGAAVFMMLEKPKGPRRGK